MFILVFLLDEIVGIIESINIKKLMNRIRDVNFEKKKLYENNLMIINYIIKKNKMNFLNIYLIYW